MIRGILGVTFVTAIVSVIATVAVIGMVLLIGATDTLTQAVFNADRVYLADMSDACDGFQFATCDYALN